VILTVRSIFTSGSFRKPHLIQTDNTFKTTRLHFFFFKNTVLYRNATFYIFYIFYIIFPLTYCLTLLYLIYIFLRFFTTSFSTSLSTSFLSLHYRSLHELQPQLRMDVSKANKELLVARDSPSRYLNLPYVSSMVSTVFLIFLLY
jgi:hypothetical protein